MQKQKDRRACRLLGAPQASDNNVKEDGNNEWIFESLDDMSTIGAMDSRIFWTALYAAPAVWIVFFFVSFLKFQLEWSVMCVVAITLSWANIYGYTKCRSVILFWSLRSSECMHLSSKEAKNKIMQAGDSLAKVSALASLAGGGGFLSSLVGSALGSGSQPSANAKASADNNV